MGSSVSAFKMSKVSGVFVSICLAALFTSGFALDCIQCNGTSIENECAKDEEGISTTCDSTAISCGFGNCTTPDSETIIMKYCAYPIPPPKTETAPKAYVCQDMEILPGYNCTICACDTDNCNSGKITTPPPTTTAATTTNGATINQIFTVGIIAVTLLSFLNQ